MSAKVQANRSKLLESLCGDPTLILTRVTEEKLITHREYLNIKSNDKVNVEVQMIDLVDKIINKGEDTCKEFLHLLETDDCLRKTFPMLKNLQPSEPLSNPVQASSGDPVQASSGDPVQASSGDVSSTSNINTDEQYQLNSKPVGLCLIINNLKFIDGDVRIGTCKDARDLSEVFTLLGFRVLMCEDQTKDQMDRALNFFASLSSSSQDVDSQLQEFRVMQWCGGEFTYLQQPPPKHGDAFICCILSHGAQGVVLGIDNMPLSIKQITRTFCKPSALTNKPKVFLIQACQGGKTQPGVLLNDLEADDSSSLSIPVCTDILVAKATVEDYAAFRSRYNGSWFVQSVCQQLKEGCQRGDDIVSILRRVNNQVSKKEGSSHDPGAVKQMPEISQYTLRKKLVLSPQNN